MTQRKKFDLAFPSPLKIGYQDVKVILTDFLDGAGVYRGDTSEIRIREGQEPLEQLNTMLHEVLHAIFNVYGLKAAVKSDEQEEHIVNALGNGLTEALVRNPALLKWIQAQL